jgi:C4-dicarboxylate-specific signal transduction histidine kinase
MIADDVTERKSSDESVRAREGEIASRSRMVAVGELASAISQAIDSPLSTLEERAAAVLTRLNSSAPGSEDHALSSVRTDLRAFAEEVRDISQKLSSLTANLLSLTPQTEPVEYKQIKVARVLASVKSICDQRFQNAGVDLRFADLSKELSVEANFAQIERILLNLLENAFDAVQNVRERWVKIEITEDEDSIYFYVSDSGPGIPIKNRSRIFDPFFTTKTLETGSGLGLTLAATLASQHNGLLRFDALHPHTRFVLQLPKRHTATQSRSLAS